MEDTRKTKEKNCNKTIEIVMAGLFQEVSLKVEYQSETEASRMGSGRYLGVCIKLSTQNPKMVLTSCSLTLPSPASKQYTSLLGLMQPSSGSSSLRGSRSFMPNSLNTGSDYGRREGRKGLLG